MDYKMQSELDRKVDKWEFNALQQELTHLKTQNQQLTQQATFTQNECNKHYYVLERLLQLLANRELPADDVDNALQDMRTYL